ncbi:MAG: hybrid sensor histidine kinase/response regulator [Gemmatimonadetes bacterium]|nr:hybrid sensor histidine kinase/response regulator [Gemmatimonadota bacterium]
MTGQRILVVEDSPTQAAALLALLEDAGYVAQSARSAEAAIALVRTQTVDLVISDVVMPGMSGYELCRLFKDDPRLCDIPFVLLTSLAEPRDVMRGMSSGADNYATKPYDGDRLLARIARVFETHAARRNRPRTGTVDINFLGTHFQITSEKEQILDILVSSFEDLVRANEESRAARKEAEDARARAEEANRSKSDFLAMMSHDLRTPLNAIGGYADLLSMGVRGPTTELQLVDLERIRHNQRHLLALVNDVLNFARIERGELSLNLSRVMLHRILRPLGAVVTPQLEKRDVRYEFVPCDTDIFVMADFERLEQVVINLLGNAAKFTMEGGAITLGCGAEGQFGVITVRDTGIGIAPEMLASIFEPFKQVNASSAGGREGVGLGLAISRELARRMGGDITVTSALGVGSTFTFSLPLAAPA